MITLGVISSLLFLPFVLVQPQNCGRFFADAFASYRPVCNKSFYHTTTALCSIREREHSGSISWNRRQVIRNVAASLLSSVSALSISLPTHAQDVAAASSSEGLVSTTKLASLLKTIPTFAIVDARGVPYFVVGEDAKLTSYFFLSYNEAKRILDVAISSSDNAIKEGRKDLIAKKKAKGENGKLTKEEEEELGTNPWKSARITSAPLDLAVSLASKGKIAGAYFRLAPSEADIEDALALDGSDDLPEGKVPLFYFEDMKVPSAVGNNEEVSPLYFQKDQLLSEWRKRNGEQNTPAVKVTELFAILAEMVRPNGSDSELKSIEFVPPEGSKSIADKIINGEKEPFRLGERLIVL